MKRMLLMMLGSSSLVFSAIEVKVPAGSSLAEARNTIRAKRQSGGTGPAVMVLGGGSHCLPEPLVLEAADSDLTIRAAPGERPTLNGSVAVGGFTPYQGEILRADVSALVREGVKYRQLLYGGERMILARYPYHTPADPLYGGWAFVDVFPTGTAPAGHNPKTNFYLKPGDLRKWAHIEDVELDIYTGDAYWNSIVPVNSIDPATRLLTLTPVGGYEIKPHSRFHFQNALEELDAPGEWFLDPRTKTLYFWPPASPEPRAARLVTLDSFIQIKAGAKNIRIERLGFTGCNGTAISMANAEDCLIAGCELNTVGGYGNGAFGEAIRINGGKRNVVRGNNIAHVGGVGVSISGGDRITLTPASHEVVNNEIHHVGVFGKGSSGVDVAGVGHRVAHNLIHDCPRIAVQMGGNNIVVEFNHLHHLCLETNDGGAIYTGGRDWLGGRGIVWRCNRIHDVIGCGQEAGGLKHPAFTFGLYPDDNAGGIDIVGNLVYRVGRMALHMHNSRDCLVENNILAFAGGNQFDCQGWKGNHPFFVKHQPTMIKGYESVAGQPTWKKMRGMGLHPKDAVRDDGTVMSGNMLRRNIMVSNDPEVKYGSVSNCSAKWNTIDRNLVWNGVHPVRTGSGDWAAWQAAGWDGNSIIANPLFENVADDDFRLKPESPAIRELGFKPLPIEKMGLIKDEWRK